MTTEMLQLPTFDDLLDAQRLLKDVAPVTPVLESSELNKLVGGRVLCKAECLQKTGSYKFRGAYNRLARMDADTRRRGIVAFSTGNFGQAVAHAATLLDIAAIVIVPKDAPSIKVNNIRAYGAEVRFYDRTIPNHREDIAQELSVEHGLTVVPPGDDHLVLAGYGTASLELFQQIATPIDALLVPCGGGGLSSGACIAARGLGRETQIATVEPQHFDDTSRSLAAKERLRIEPGHMSICDAILTPTPAELPFRILSEHCTRSFVVTDTDTRRAMAIAFKHLKIVLEPAGAIALAAVLNGSVDCGGKTVATICSGGGVDPALYASVISEFGCARVWTAW